MAAPPNPIDATLGPCSSISVTTVHMAGLLVDVYGLNELPESASRVSVSCLWLHHPRGRKKEDMGDIACRCVAAWNQKGNGGNGGNGRGLIALAFDQRNHGTRMVYEPANGAWSKGNKTHAQDMFGTIAGAVSDQVGLLDAVGGYLFHDSERDIVLDQHLALGVSLGGHSVWQLMFAEPRVTAGVVIVGCPDYINLMSDRANRSKLSTCQDGSSFLGSKDFPPSLVAACRKMDPKAILLGTDPVPSSAEGGIPETVARALQYRLQDKKFLLCSGGDDRLVPYACGKLFLHWFKEAIRCCPEANISLEDNLYPGIGHTFSAEMVKDAVRFVTDVVASAGQQEKEKGGPRDSKI
ncbi:hypothetical protein QBC46DRAFT_370692 [Diplogelasinospora grovesii]|uniref:Uncharacterized protein n=1 Tax=Diplogelasinospora grovesii TaxID=303347 RepID=A0AAN6NJ32_9PEZI|nr:hypothetical protein QBC46DRAFT_370692 [Diplogelasinospora grovesii]